jgi:hypothetical protein
MTTVTHIAGPSLDVCGRVIQRCSMCGEKLVDNKNCAAPLNEDGSVPSTPTWGVGRLVRVTEGNPTWYELLDDSDGKLPADTCLDLIE